MIADDISAEDFTSYGNDFVETKNIDSLAKQGLVFDNAYLTASSCSPSRASTISSRYPHNLGEAGELHRVMPTHLATLPKTLRANGYYTAQSGKSHFGGNESAKNILEAGFVDYDEGKVGDKGLSNTGAANWIKVLRKIPKDKPFFLWFAARDAHRSWDSYWTDEMGEKLNVDDIKVPQELVDNKATRQDLVSYYNEVRRFDYNVGKVIKELEKQGRLEDTFIIVTADNGRAFPRAKTRTNNHIGGKAAFIVYCPSYTEYKGERVSSLVSTIDIAPTILDLAGIEKPESFQGVSFSASLKDKDAKVRDYVFAEQNWHGCSAHVRTVRTKDYSYTINARPNKALMPPIDVFKSDSYKSLVDLKKSGASLNPMQSDIFAEARSPEEFYIFAKDKDQVQNEIANPEYSSVVEKLRKVMQQWQSETGDSVPENYSKDKYNRNTGKNISGNNYGEVAGASNDAEHINNSGIYLEMP